MTYSFYKIKQFATPHREAYNLRHSGAKKQISTVEQVPYKQRNLCSIWK